MDLQPELRQPFPKLSQEPLSFRPVLESDHEIIGVADHDHVPLRHFLAPDLCPQIENMMQVHVRQQRRYHRLNAKGNMGRVGPSVASQVREAASVFRSDPARSSASELSAGW